MERRRTGYARRIEISTLAGTTLAWLFAFVLVAWSLAQGLVSAHLLFVSVLVHELGHSLMAGAHGLLAQSIPDAKHLAH